MLIALLDVAAHGIEKTALLDAEAPGPADRRVFARDGTLYVGAIFVTWALRRSHMQTGWACRRILA